MYDYFLNYVVEKEAGYERKNDEPYPTLYEQWLDETYGRSKLGQFWDYCSDYDNIQTALDIGGFFWDGFDVMNAVLYALQGDWEQAAWSSVAMIPMAGSAINANAKAGKKVLSAVGNLAPVAKTKKRITSLKLTFRVSEEGTGLFAQIRKIFDDIYSKMNRSQCYVEIAGVGRVPIDEIEGILEDGAGNVIVKMGDAADDAVSDGRKVILSGQWKNVNEAMDEFSRAYQKQITGQEGMAWVQNGVKFDGMKDGVLLEVKGRYAQFINKDTGEFFDWFSGKQSFIDQAKRQINASEGAKIQWYFAEEETLNVIQDLFAAEGITGIELIFVAPK